MNFLCIRSSLGKANVKRDLGGNLFSHNEEQGRTDITVVEIAVHLPIDETFSECIKYKIRKKKGVFI